MSCDDGNPLLNALVGFFSFLGDPIGTIMKGIADFVLAAAVEVFGDLLTSIPTLPNTDTAKDINNQSNWIVVYLAVGSLLFAAGRMAVQQRGDAGLTALKGIMRVVLVSGAATTIVGAAASLSDRYSTYLFQQGAQKQLDSIGQCSDGGSIQAFLLMVLAFLLLLAGIVQTILLYIRLGVMILLLGTLPMAAAASMTDWGAGWWRKHIGWMIAWLLYKPAAGLVMYAGSVMTTYRSEDGGGGSDVNVRIAGIGVMMLSAVALPALLKLVMPATAALGTGGALSGTLSGVGGSVASGARQLGGATGSPGGMGGSSGPSGASGSAGSGGASGRGGSSGAAGSAGSSGSSGSSGASGPSGAAKGAGGSGAAAGAGRAAAAAAGPAGVAAMVAGSALKSLGKTASGALDGADGGHGHNG